MGLFGDSKSYLEAPILMPGPWKALNKCHCVFGRFDLREEKSTGWNYILFSSVVSLFKWVLLLQEH